MTSSLVMRMQPDEIACADIFRLVGAVNAEQRVLVALEEIEAARAQRIVRAAVDEVRNVAEPLLDVGGRRPGRPLFLAADLGDAGPRPALLRRRSRRSGSPCPYRQHVVEIARIGSTTIVPGASLR